MPQAEQHVRNVDSVPMGGVARRGDSQAGK